MDRTDNRRARGQRSRQSILRAATRLFGLYGYDSVTMRQIGEAAGLDNSSIYRHFPNKEALARAVIQDVLQEMAPLAESLDATHGEPSLDQLVETSVAFARRLWDRPEAARLLLSWIMTTGEPRSGFRISIKLSDRNELASRIVGRLLDWIERAVRAGAIRPVEPIDGLVNILAVLTCRPATAGYFVSSLEEGRSADERRRSAEVELRLFLTGAFAPPSAGRT